MFAKGRLATVAFLASILLLWAGEPAMATTGSGYAAIVYADQFPNPNNPQTAAPIGVDPRKTTL